MPTGCNSTDEELARAHMEYVVELERGRHFNRLSPEVHELLAILAEECGEVVQRIGKVLRHGIRMNPYGDGQRLNVELLEDELTDVYTIVGLLGALNVLNQDRIDAGINGKLERLRRPDILHHSTLLRPRPCRWCGSTARIQVSPEGHPELVECKDRSACLVQAHARAGLFQGIIEDYEEPCGECGASGCVLPHGRGCP